MSNVKSHIVILILIMVFIEKSLAQATLTLDETINMAKVYAIEYKELKNAYISEYLKYSHFKLNKLPTISFTANPIGINRSITPRYDFQTNIETFKESNALNSNIGIIISKNIQLTGGIISIGGDISRVQNFGKSELTFFNVSPFRINYSQPLFTHNPYRWEKVEMPLKLKLAKMQFLKSEQDLNQRVAHLYFNLVKSFQLYEHALLEVQNADTLFNAGIFLLELNIIIPNEMLELELKKTNAKVQLLKQSQEFADARFELNKFMTIRIPENRNPIMEEHIPKINLNINRIRELTQISNPFYLEIEIEEINLRKRNDLVNKQQRFNSDLRFSFGLNQGGETLGKAFGRQTQFQNGSVSLAIPVVDWGKNRDNRMLANLEIETSELKIQTKIKDFEQILQNSLLENDRIAAIIENSKLALDLAYRVYNTKLEQFKIGQITLQELNQSQAELLNAKGARIDSISRFWANYFQLQSIVLHDLITMQPFTIDYEGIIYQFYNH